MEIGYHVESLDNQRAGPQLELNWTSTPFSPAELTPISVTILTIAAIAETPGHQVADRPRPC